MSKCQKGHKIGTNGKRNMVALTEEDKTRVTADSLIQRVSQQGEDWYHDEANDLHLCDFIWFAWVQTA